MKLNPNFKRDFLIACASDPVLRWVFRTPLFEKLKQTVVLYIVICFAISILTGSGK